MTQRRRTLPWLAWAAATAMPGTALAQARRRPDPNPDATIEIEQVRVGVLAIGGSIGGGRLRFRGEEFSFSVRGIEFGALGVATLSARGEVFNLRRREDFAGRYAEQVEPRFRGEGAQGPETRWLRNAAGVEIRLRAERAGGQLRLNAAGVTIEFR